MPRALVALLVQALLAAGFREQATEFINQALVIQDSSDDKLECCCKKSMCGHDEDLRWHSYRLDIGKYACCKLTKGKLTRCPLTGYRHASEELLPHVSATAGYQGGACALPSCPEGLERSSDGRSCHCPTKGQGGKMRLVWYTSTLEWDWSSGGECAKEECPRHSSGHPDCRCDAGFVGTITWEEGEYKGFCEVVPCPENAGGLPCSCLKGTRGKVEWDADTGAYRGSCEILPCPEHAEGAPACKCVKGYRSDHFEWRDGQYWGSCKKLPCPKHAVGEWPDCRCGPFLTGEVTWVPWAWGYWRYGCEEVQCPKHAWGAPDCRCEAGYTGELAWDGAVQAFKGSCTKVPCPTGSAGESLCTCTEVGYSGLAWSPNAGKYTGSCKPQPCPEGAHGAPDCRCGPGYMGSVSWDAAAGAYSGGCERVPCPWYAMGHPQCKCQKGYQGHVSWDPATREFRGACKLAWVLEISSGSCAGHGAEPIMDRAVCEHAASALQLDLRRSRRATVEKRWVSLEGCYYMPVDFSGQDLYLGVTGGQGDKGARHRDEEGESSEGRNYEASIYKHALCRVPSMAAPVCSWDLFGPSGAKFNDVAQGQLGTCYFLAALASVAHARPEVIEGMISKNLATDPEHPVYRVHFTLGGQERAVAVDDALPVHRRDMSPVFVSYNDGHDFWPIVLEKAWAKVYGSFKGIEAGTGYEALKAISQAPMQTVQHEGPVGEFQENLWKTLQLATELRYPLFGASRGGFGLADSHAYAVLGAGQVEGERAVWLYNPWGHNRYSGRLAGKGGGPGGSFWVALEEYVQAFSSTSLAEIETGYKLSSLSLPLSNGKVTATVYFEVRHSTPFSVQLVWAHARREKCPLGSYSVLLLVEPPAGGGKCQRQIHRMRSARVDCAGGRGGYKVQAEVDFNFAPWLPEAVLNVYAAEPTELLRGAARQEEPEPQQLLDEQGLACRDAVLHHGRLDNAEEIMAQGADPLFPPDLSSIAPPGTKCGDSAQGINTDCEKFNHWSTLGNAVC